MKTSFRQSFVRDLKKIKNAAVRRRIQRVIAEVEAAADLRAINQLKQLSGTDNLYRIRLGDYRIGMAVETDTVEFVRCLHRRDLYRFFP